MSDLRHVFFVGVEPPAPSGRAPSSTLSSADRLARSPLSCPVEPTAGLAPVEPFLSWLCRQAGLEAASYRSQALQRRVAACLRALRVASVEAAQSRIEHNPELLPRALDAVLIGVSGFFRDPPVFENLRRLVMPRLLRDRPCVRVYSAGCSEGQELYSMAILLHELGAAGPHRLVGVDCRPGAVQSARAGWFPHRELAGVEAGLRERYFLPAEENGARVKPELGKGLEWELGNLLAPEPTARGWDVILCRNVAIYLAPEAAAGLWERLTGQLETGGVLVMGKAERPPSSLPLEPVHSCIYRKSQR